MTNVELKNPIRLPFIRHHHSDFVISKCCIRQKDSQPSPWS